MLGKGLRGILQLFIAVAILNFYNGFCNFTGGSISWFKHRDGIRFTYRLTWERGSGPCGPNCSVQDLNKLGSVPSNLSSLYWKCSSGCGAHQRLSDINYILTSVSNDTIDWEQGENSFFHNFTGPGPFVVSLDGLPWATSAPGLGRLLTTVDLGIRNDSGLPNGSPIAAVQPYIGVQFGCKTKVHLPVVDPDADSLRCRFATTSECDGACTNLPSSLLDKEDCSLTIDATRANGYRPNSDYRLTVMVEDYPDYTISVGSEIRSIRRPISKIPLQLTIKVLSDSGRCANMKSKFDFDIYPNHNESYRFSYPGPSVGIFKSNIYLKTQDTNKTDFIISIPSGMNWVRYLDNRNRSDVIRVNFSMTPLPKQSADTLLCLWGRQNGITSDRFCYTPIMFDNDNCQGWNPCENNGICMNLYHRFTCKCPHGFKPKNCSQTVTCADFPCKNNGTCVDTGTQYTCSCPSGFIGLDCEIKSTVPKRKLDVDNTNNRIFLITVGSIGGLLLLAALTGCCCWWFFAAATRRRPRSSESRKVKPVPTE